MTPSVGKPFSNIEKWATSSLMYVLPTRINNPNTYNLPLSVDYNNRSTGINALVMNSTHCVEDIV
jgi:hypothetical protein